MSGARNVWVVAAIIVAAFCGVIVWLLLGPDGSVSEQAPVSAPLDASTAERTDADGANKFVKYLIKPPKDSGVDRFTADGALEGLKIPDGVDRHLARRLAERAAQRAEGKLDGGSPNSGNVDDRRLHAVAGYPGVKIAVGVEGALGRSRLIRVLGRHAGEVKRCYRKQIPRDAKSKQQVEAVFTIGPTGQVLVAKIEWSTISGRAPHRCMTRAMRQWTFPKAKGGISVVRAAYELERAR